MNLSQLVNTSSTIPMVAPPVYNPQSQVKLPSIHEILNRELINDFMNYQPAAGQQYKEYQQPKPIQPIIKRNDSATSATSSILDNSLTRSSSVSSINSANNYSFSPKQLPTPPPSIQSPGNGDFHSDNKSLLHKKKRSNLPKKTTIILLSWLNDHLNHPYPNSFEKNYLMNQTGLNNQQLSNWFINARRRKIGYLKEIKGEK